VSSILAKNGILVRANISNDKNLTEALGLNLLPQGTFVLLI
jgi:hypothetical protein